MKRTGILLMTGMMLVCLLAACGSDAGSGTAEGNVSEKAVESEIVASTEDDTKIEETAEEDESVPAEYRSALRKAESYSEMMHMSKAGLYDQLTSEYGEQFPEDAAQYAIDNIEADWNANALAKAEEYSESMHMSKQGIYDQLVSEYGEKFTAEEADYAISQLD